MILVSFLERLVGKEVLITLADDRQISGILIRFELAAASTGIVYAIVEDENEDETLVILGSGTQIMLNPYSSMLEGPEKKKMSGRRMSEICLK
jgi:hypothetical protein